MKSFVVTLLAVIFLSACGSPKEATSTVQAATPKTSAEKNVLIHNDLIKNLKEAEQLLKNLSSSSKYLWHLSIGANTSDKEYRQEKDLLKSLDKLTIALRKISYSAEGLKVTSTDSENMIQFKNLQIREQFVASISLFSEAYVDLHDLVLDRYSPSYYEYAYKTKPEKEKNEIKDGFAKAEASNKEMRENYFKLLAIVQSFERSLRNIDLP